jgi:hypothetical protein
MKRYLAAIISLTPLVCSADQQLADIPSLYRPNYSNGYADGYATGYDIGFDNGSGRGTTEGVEAGDSDGYNDGWDDAYQVAYENAYVKYFRVGKAEGWNSGVRDGFDEGLEEARRLLATANFGSLTISSGTLYSGGLGGLVTNRGSTGGGINSLAAVTRTAIHNIDWAAHYYDVGYDDGYDHGLSIGDKNGYDVAYPVAYAAAYEIGFFNGSSLGTYHGALDGSSDGSSDGWQIAYDPGYDAGYSVGLRVDAHLMRDLLVPVPIVDEEIVFPVLKPNLRPSAPLKPVVIPGDLLAAWPVTVTGAIDVGVPEPATFCLLACALTAGAYRRFARSRLD